MTTSTSPSATPLAYRPVRSVDQVVRWGVVGMGGFAVSVTDALIECAKRSPDVVQLVAACDPALSSMQSRAGVLQSHGVQVLDSMDALLKLDIDAVWLPVPIDLHRPFAEAAFRAGKAVMCEKPPAGCVQDLDAMTSAARAANLPLLFGYQDLYDSAMLKLKRLLLSGVIGQVTSATVAACWPRDDVYYARNTWAGKLKRSDTWVMDSPIMNALAHPVNLSLFLLGATESSAANPVSVEGELYRVNPIENFDTVSVRGSLEGGSTLTVILTHACKDVFGPEVTIHGELGKVSIIERDVVLTKKDGSPGTRFQRDAGYRVDLAKRAAQYFRGEPNDQIGVATPEIVRSHLLLCNGLSESTPVRTLSRDAVAQVKSERGTLSIIRDVEQYVRACEAQGKLFSEVGAPWVTAAQAPFPLKDYRSFAGPAQA
jgi:predicted dehydrogenase